MALFTFVMELEKLMKDCDSVLDVGCGSDSPLRLINRKRRMVGVDLFAKSARESKGKKIHDKCLVMDALKIDKKFKQNSFDAVVALDLIEHLKKKDGYKLLDMMEKVASKMVVVLTPNGFIEQEDEENELQEHLSGWEIVDFEKRGYKVLGMYGYKKLRGDKAGLVHRPKVIWGMISELTHYLCTRSRPSQAFSILCYKRLGKKKVRS